MQSLIFHSQRPCLTATTPQDIAKAQREIRDLEMSLGEERARLEDIVKERMSLAQEKSVLEARLAKTTEVSDNRALHTLP